MSCVKPNTNQWKATLYDVVGIPTVYHRYLPLQIFRIIQSDVMLEFYFDKMDSSNDVIEKLWCLLNLNFL